MANVIVGIHGLAKKPARQEEAACWEAAIREGLAKNCGIHAAQFTYRMVYWADLLYKYPLHHDPHFAFDALYNDEPYGPAAEGALQSYTEGWLDHARGVISAAAGGVLDALKGYVGLDALADVVLERVLRDLEFYYDDHRQIGDRAGQLRPARLVLMDELNNTLRELEGERLMVVAHSMGSIIAYDVLRRLGRDTPAFPCADFVTIGSPLGLPHVKAKVYEECAYATVRVRTPTIITERWVNYADRRDPVAVDCHLADDYAPNDRGVHVVDDLILNDYISPAGKRNCHKSYGYLRTPEISAHLREFLH